MKNETTGPMLAPRRCPDIAESAVNLKNLAASLKKYANTELLIVGHTDALGTTTNNQVARYRCALQRHLDHWIAMRVSG